MCRFQPVRLPLPFCPLIVVCVLAATPLLAQTAQGGAAETDRDDTGTATAVVQGIVTTTENGLPLANALVEVEGSRTRVYTDRHGQYRLALSGGTATLRFARIGYSTRSEEVRLETGQRLSLNVALSFESIALDPVVVLLDRTRMVGDAVQAGQLAGAAQLLTRADLEARPLLFDNVHEVLRQLPGVNVQDEEGYGLRPNIGLRGTGVERSSKITLMEDGVLIAPAPYAAPAAYYFPVVGRMEAVEVRKGSSQIRYGPRTVGGAVNFVSSSIPDRLSWNLDLSGGENATGKAKGRVGGASEHFGWLLETYQIGTDGFKQLESGADTGFRVGDYLGKLRVNTSRDAGTYQELELKLGYTDETSRETYLGLSDGDFRQNPFLRYAASANDVMNAEHSQIQLRHFVRPGGRFDLTTTLYRNDFARNWYKLGSVEGTGISAVLEDPATWSDEFAILRGGDSGADALTVRANNREYVSEGVQSVLGFRLDGAGVSHGLEAGIRLHRDREDRFQFDDRYRMEAGSMILTDAGAPGSQDNRVGEASAIALYLQDEIRAGSWTFTPGIRWETIDFTRTDYGTDDPGRVAADRVRRNEVSALVPGMAVTWELTPATQFFGGVHRGFGPPGPGADELTRSEESVNYELGTRLRRSGLSVQATAFFSDYRNILGRATLSSGESGAGDSFNGGAVHAAGLELALDYDPSWSRSLPVRVPMRLSWTHSRAEFRTAFESDFGAWGEVEPGDRLPYLPENQLNGSVGVEDARWKLALTAVASGAMRTRAGQGPIPAEHATDAFLIFNLAGEYALHPGGTVYAGIQNLGDERYIVARRPAGVRPGLPRTLQVGVRIHR